MSAIVLAGHGSQRSPAAGAGIRQLAARLVRAGVAQEVVAAFWKEEPSFRDVLPTLVANEVFVVPMLMAAGYFAATVLPRELAAGSRHGQRVTLTRPLGEWSGWGDCLGKLVEATLARENVSPAAASLLVVGHGTLRHAGTRRSTFALAKQIQVRQPQLEVQACFLDCEPCISSFVADLCRPVVLAFPFFVGAGLHVERDLPELLGPARRRGIRVLMLPSAGTELATEAMILDLLADAGFFARTRENLSEVEA